MHFVCGSTKWESEVTGSRSGHSSLELSYRDPQSLSRLCSRQRIIDIGLFSQGMDKNTHSVPGLRCVGKMVDAPGDGLTVENAALWQVDLADIAKQTDLPTGFLLDALKSSTVQPAVAATTPGKRDGCLFSVRAPSSTARQS
jgi:hypothetical protein